MKLSQSFLLSLSLCTVLANQLHASESDSDTCEDANESSLPQEDIFNMLHQKYSSTKEDIESAYKQQDARRLEHEFEMSRRKKQKRAFICTAIGMVLTTGAVVATFFEPATSSTAVDFNTTDIPECSLAPENDCSKVVNHARCNEICSTNLDNGTIGLPLMDRQSFFSDQGEYACFLLQSCANEAIAQGIEKGIAIGTSLLSLISAGIMRCHIE